MASELWKPMLAAKPEPEELDNVLAVLPHPALWSPKFDGIRATVQNGKLYSRTLKLIPNLAMQKLWGRKELNGLDGEIIVGPPTAEDCFNRSTSLVMSRNKPLEGAAFNVFDSFFDDTFDCRLEDAEETIYQAKIDYVYLVKHELLKTHTAALKYEAKQCALGHEGVMRRDPNGVYKQGRSTLNEQGLIAVKRFVDAEAIVLATYEQEQNTNAQTTNELGRSKRSTHKAGKVGKDTLGGFTVCMPGSFASLKQAYLSLEVSPKDSRLFNVGGGKGLTNVIRAELWQQRDKLLGRFIKFRYQKIGTMIKPREPIFLGFRDKKDM